MLTTVTVLVGVSRRKIPPFASTCYALAPDFRQPEFQFGSEMANEGVLHELDVDGEIVFLVRQPERPFIKWPESKGENQPDEQLQDPTPDHAAEPSGHLNIRNGEDPGDITMRIRASSSHLRLGSSILRPASNANGEKVASLPLSATSRSTSLIGMRKHF